GSAIVASVIPRGPCSGDDHLRPPGDRASAGPMERRFDTLCFGYGLVEAPRADADGTVLFSDVLGGGVHRWSGDGTVATVLPKRRGIGGLVPHAEGGLVVSGRDVSHVRDGTTRVLFTCEGVLGFNDLTTDVAGRVYVGSLRSPAFTDDEAPRVPG